MWLLVALSLLPGAQTSLVMVAPGEALTATSLGHGVAVVFVPGLCGSAFAFRKVFPAVAKAGFRAVVIEPLGFGNSARPAAADYSLAAQSVRLEAALDSLELHRVILVTQNVATSLALRLAVQRPDLVGGIVSLEGGASETISSPGLRQSMRFAGLAGKIGGPALLRRMLEKRLLSASGDSAWVDRAAVDGYAAAALTDVGGTLAAMRAMSRALEPEPLGPRLFLVSCPMELLLGAAPHEGGVPAGELKTLRENLHDLRVIVVRGSGTFIAEERPEAVLASVRRLLRRASDPGEASVVPAR